MKYYTTGEFAKLIGVHVKTIQNWDREGTLKPERRTPTNRRQYSQKQVDDFGKGVKKDEVE